LVLQRETDQKQTRKNQKSILDEDNLNEILARMYLISGFQEVQCLPPADQQQISIILLGNIDK